VQAPSASIADNARIDCSEGAFDVGWVLLEVALALAIAIGIVWWTIPKKPPRE
jgi:hypothetical protein